MKTKNIESVYRHAATPAARLAHWQAQPAPRRLSEVRARQSKSYYAEETLARSRAALISSQGPELSSPEAERPVLWISGESDPEVQDVFPGRDFLVHQGWYADEHQEETLETVAVRLTRFPGLLFYGVRDSEGYNFRVMLEDWEEIDYSEAEGDYSTSEALTAAAREVVRCNDSSTQHEAEESREYHRKDRAERDIEENRETLSTLRAEIKDLCHELKQLCPSPLAGEYPAAGKAVRRALSALLSERRELMEENEGLAASI